MVARSSAQGCMHPAVQPFSPLQSEGTIAGVVGKYSVVLIQVPSLIDSDTSVDRYVTYVFEQEHKQKGRNETT